MLTAVVPPAHQPVARIGDTIDLQGHDLDGTNREVRARQRPLRDRRHDRRRCRRRPPAPTALVQFTLDAALAATLPVGVYRVAARVRACRRDRRRARPTAIAMVLAPQMTNLPLDVSARRRRRGELHDRLRAGAARRADRRAGARPERVPAAAAPARRRPTLTLRDPERAGRRRTSRGCASTASRARSSICRPTRRRRRPS